jgi:hypothetical protein
MSDEITRHCEELNRCNQRGGRMLSVFDLLEARTLNLEFAAYLMARISRGASFMVGAVPGGAGKTTVMCALLNFVPIELPLVAATSEAVREAIETTGSQPSCYVCHEIGFGHYFAYLWGRYLRDYCRLIDYGHMLATNLHADDLQEAWDQVCGDNGVPLENFNRFELLIFLRVATRTFDSQCRVEKVYSGNGSSGHVLVYGASQEVRPEPDSEGYLADSEYVIECQVFLEEVLHSGVRTIEETRQCVADFLADSRHVG